MKRDSVYTIYWFFALAPFLTALPLFFLMPENASARYYALAMLEREGTRFEVFLIPAVWFLADTGLHFIYKYLERPYETLPWRLIVPRISTSAIFCGLAITAELLFYQAAMMVF